MNESQLFFKIAENFKVFSVSSEEDVKFLRSISNDKKELRNNIKIIFEKHRKIKKSNLKLEILNLMIDACFKNNFEDIEICACLTIFKELLSLSFRRNTKFDLFDKFKYFVLRHAMDRPPHQIGIFKKHTVEKITDFFIENIYKRYELLTYLLTKKTFIELENKELLEIRMPHILDLELAQELLPRSCKILKQYTENKKPKTELEQKIDLILEWERERLDAYMEEKFDEQDAEFNTKLEEIMKKKK
jgi:hypothetical protein